MVFLRLKTAAVSKVTTSPLALVIEEVSAATCGSRAVKSLEVMSKR